MQFDLCAVMHFKFKAHERMYMAKTLWTIQSQIVKHKHLLQQFDAHAQQDHFEMKHLLLLGKLCTCTIEKGLRLRGYDIIHPLIKDQKLVGNIWRILL